MENPYPISVDNTLKRNQNVDNYSMRNFRDINVQFLNLFLIAGGWIAFLNNNRNNVIMKVMKTIIEKIDKHHIDIQIMEKAGEILKRGGLVAFPTETVYGLGANALDEEAAKKTYAAKGRPSDNPLIVHIADVEALDAIVEHISEKARRVMEKFWPGPLTLIFQKTEKVPFGTTGGLNTVAVRMPVDEIALALIRAGGGYVSAPSANTSGRPSPTSAMHVADDSGWRKCRYWSRVNYSGYDGRASDDSQAGSNHERDVGRSDW